MSSRAYGGVEIGITGASELSDKLRALGVELPARAHDALLAEAEAVIPTLEELAPIGGPEEHDAHIGRLRGSARVSEGTNELVIGILMGGEDVPEAMPQESKTSYRHPHGGEAHYFSDAIRAERPLFLQRMAARLASDLEDIVR